MPFYVSPEQSMRDKADYARKGVARSRSSVVLQYSGGILMVTPNMSSVLHKISEIYDRIAFAAVGRYNEYEVLRKAGVTYADVTGYQFDRGDVTARGLANWYAQALGTNFSEPSPAEASTRCMSSDSGASARRVMVALEPSMKNRTLENSATPSRTPTRAAVVRRGLRIRSRQT